MEWFLSRSVHSQHNTRQGSAAKLFGVGMRAALQASLLSSAYAFAVETAAAVTLVLPFWHFEFTKTLAPINRRRRGRCFTASALDQAVAIPSL